MIRNCTTALMFAIPDLLSKVITRLRAQFRLCVFDPHTKHELYLWKFQSIVFLLFIVPFLAFGQLSNNSNCPVLLSPVTGSNGVTYLNSCYAELDGETTVTPGIGYGGCIDPSKMDPTFPCENDYNPVCGCNGVTYFNECEAEAAGVVYYRTGPCSEELTCYDPGYIRASGRVDIDFSDGIIRPVCDDEDSGSVCGCDGITYPSACLAEASGVTTYITGRCSDDCIQPFEGEDSEELTCPQDYDPVCGCNDVTYINECEAKRAGVTSWTPGVCGSPRSWCNIVQPVPIQCGDFLAAESNINATNFLINYSDCIQGTFNAPEKVYIINKETVGNLQIGLEITTPGLDLDLFLLDGNCESVNCLKSSTTSNERTNNEGIILRDAPIGTYYLVVDGQFASSQGNYRLEVSCGYLDCDNSSQLECGVPIFSSNIDGGDAVSLYSCSNGSINVENNGPESIHEFILTERGEVSISLTNLTANLELFLLDECDQNSCLDYSQNAGTEDEFIRTFLEAGNYQVVVEGYNGAVGDYELLVDCPNEAKCDLDFVELSSSLASCGKQDGSITVVSSGGEPGFILSWEGPVSGNISTFSNSSIISDLPAGTYTIEKVDQNGCLITSEVSIESDGILDLTTIPRDAICGSSGAIQIVIRNGTAPFTFSVTGPVGRNFSTNQSFFRMNELPTGIYTIYVVDDLGCSITSEVEIIQGESDFKFTAIPNAVRCQQLGSIEVSTAQGTPPYNLSLRGPVGGRATVEQDNFTIRDLPEGTYQLRIEDANLCSYEEQVFIDNNSIELNATAITGLCGEMGAIDLTIFNGEPGFDITWNGPESGQIESNAPNLLLENLLPGKYEISVEDESGCVVFTSAFLEEPQTGLSVDFIPTEALCGRLGGVWINVLNGSGPFEVKWTGRSEGTQTFDSESYNIENLIPGDYSFTVTDSKNCGFQQAITVNEDKELEFSSEAQNGKCGETGSIFIQIDNGNPLYTISWSGPQNGRITTPNSFFQIQDLPTGIYNIDIQDGNDCSSAKAVSVQNKEGGLRIETKATPSICDTPGAFELNIIGGSADFLIEIEGPVNISENITTSTKTYSNLPPGIYLIRVEDQSGCEVSTQVSIEDLQDELQLRLQAINGLCGKEGSATVNIEGGNPIYLLEINGPSSGTFELRNGSFTLWNLPAGLYEATVSDQNGCTVSATVELPEVNPGVQLDLEAQEGACDGNGKIDVYLEFGNPIYTISWSGPDIGKAETSDSFFQIKDLASGSYLIQVEDADGCTSSSNIFIENKVFSADLQSYEPGCDGLGSAEVNLSGGIPPYLITWDGTAAGEAVSDNPNFQINNLVPGSYNVLIADINNCLIPEMTFEINERPTFGMDINTSDDNCDNNTGKIEIQIQNGNPPYKINWIGSESGEDSFSGNQFTLDNLPGSPYKINVIDADGCELEQDVVVKSIVNQLNLSVSVILDDCVSETDVFLELQNGEAPYQINWTGPQSGTVETSEEVYEILQLPPGDYTINFFDNLGCIAEKRIQIYEKDIPSVSITAEKGLCGNPGQIVVQVEPSAVNYQLKWDGPQSGSTSFTGSQYIIADLPAGVYTVEYINDNACVDGETVDIQAVSTNFDLQLALQPNICGLFNSLDITLSDGEGPYQIQVNGPSDYSLTTEENTARFNELEPGIYQVQAFDVYNCEASAVFTVQSEMPQLFNLLPQNGVVNELGFIRLVPTDLGEAPYSVSWNGPVFGQVTLPRLDYSIDDLFSGTYSIEIIDDQGCVQTEEVNISNAETDLVFDINLLNNVCGDATSLSINIPEGIPPFSISWSGPTSGTSSTTDRLVTISNLLEGDYLIEVEDYQQLSRQKEIEVQNSVVNLFDIDHTNQICDQLGSISLLNINGQPPYRISWIGPQNGNLTIADQSFNINNLVFGTYQVRLIDANDCEAIKSTTIDRIGSNLDFVVDLIESPCSPTKAVDLTILGGTPPFLISWTGPSTGNLTQSNRSVNLESLTPGTYSLSVSDLNQCSLTSSFTTGSFIDPPFADFEFTVDGNIVSFSNSSSADSFTWTFGDGNQSQSGSPVHVYCCAGSYQVCLTASNECGIDTICKMVEIAGSDDLTNLIIDDGIGVKNSTIQVPVRIKNLDILASLAGSIIVDDPSVARVVSLQAGSIEPQYNSQSNIFNYFDNTGRGKTVIENEILFYLDVQLIGIPGSATNISLGSTPLPIELGSIENGTPVSKSYFLVNGNIQISNTASIDGNVQTFWGQGVSNVAVDISTEDGLVTRSFTNGSGQFELPFIPVGSTYRVSPAFDSIHINGLSTYALFVGQRFILGLDPPQIYSPYQIIAGDANCNGSFTTLDLFTIQQLIIGKRDQFSDCPSWVFVNANENMPDDFNTYNVFPYGSSETLELTENTTLNFIGVKVGDILGRAVPNFAPPSDERHDKEKLVLEASDLTVEAGQPFDLSFTSRSFTGITSLQLEIKFVAKALELLEFIPNQQVDFKNVAFASTDDAIKISWFNSHGMSSTIDKDETLFTLRFRPKSNFESLEDLIQINLQHIPAIASKEDNRLVAVDLALTERVLTTTSLKQAISPSIKLFQNTPNPFNGNTVIHFEVSGPMPVKIYIQDIHGRIIKSFNGHYKSGKHQISVDAQDFSKGVYYYSLQSGPNLLTKSMIVY